MQKYTVKYFEYILFISMMVGKVLFYMKRFSWIESYWVLLKGHFHSQFGGVFLGQTCSNIWQRTGFVT